MHYFHDGYFHHPEPLSERVIEFLKEGWKIESIFPPMGVYGASILASHPDREFPSWEQQ